MDNLMVFEEHISHQSEVKQATVYITIDQIKQQSSTKAAKMQSNSTIRLAKSIKKYGILTPIEVKPTTDVNGYLFYEIIDGNKRLRAAESIGLQQVPCQILSPSDPKYAQISAINRLKQEKLHYFDHAKALFELTKRYRMTQEEVAARLGYSQSAVANKLRLLHFTDTEQVLIKQLSLTERHARALLCLSEPQAREILARKIAQNQLTVAETEQFIKLIKEKSANNATDFPSERQKSEQKYQSIPTPEGVLPKKFALRDLTPLYNSIERVLGIFQKTGVRVGYCKEENDNFVDISIRIPKPNEF